MILVNVVYRRGGGWGLICIFDLLHDILVQRLFVSELVMQLYGDSGGEIKTVVT